MPLKAELTGSIADLPRAEWDALDPTGHPFARHAFLESLESTGCVGGESGWMPRHLAIRDARGAIVAAVPQYLKAHSWGEFVFDMSWAQGYARSGIEYYPKLLSAIPFTPVTGPRLLVHPDFEADGLRDSLAELLIESARAAGASGAHVNFTTAEDQAALERAGFLRRHDCRFLWRNRGLPRFRRFPRPFPRGQAQEGPARTASRGRIGHRVPHAARRGDGRRALAGGVRVFGAHVPAARQRPLPERRLPAPGVAPAARHDRGESRRTRWHAGGGRDLLPGRRLPVRPLLGFRARRGLSLHFEACYYQGIDYCIEHGLQRSSPGTQGEHKIARGFEPTRTWSAHWLARSGIFATRSAATCSARRAAIDDYVAAAARAPALPPRRRRPGVIPWLRPTDPPEAFPPVSDALDEPAGLLAPAATSRRRDCSPRIGAASSPGTRAGQPILWWSPDPRAVLFPAELRVTRSLAKTIRNRRLCRDRVDRAFAGVIEPVRRRHAAAGGHLDHARHARGVCASARARPCPLRRDLARRAPGRRPVRRRARAGVLRRVDVQPERDASKVALHGLVQCVAHEQRRADRLPDRQPAPARASARARFPGASSSRTSSGASRTCDRYPVGPDRTRRATGISALAGRFSLQWMGRLCRIRAPSRAVERVHGERRRDPDGRRGRRDPAQHDVPRAVEERPRRHRPHLRQDAQELHPHPHRRRRHRRDDARTT